MINHSQEFWEDLNNYGKKLSSLDLPIIYSLTHLCILARVNINGTFRFCQSDRIAGYKRFKLRKKRGGFRIIHTPKEKIKYLQRWILHNILTKIPSHNSCKGFDPGQSIVGNAKIHTNADAILKIDLLRFYDSINEKRIYGLFKAIGYHSNLAVSLAKICTIMPDKLFLNSFKEKEENLKNSIVVINKDGLLPQGSPCSPKLSNLIAMNLDNRLSALAKKRTLCYSRYADDITFSGTLQSLSGLEKIVYRIIRDENFFANHSKTKLLKRGAPFFVTGLSVNGQFVKVPKKLKTEIEHHLFHCIKNGVHNHLKVCNIQNRNFKDWLLGKISFVNSIEPELGKRYFSQFSMIVWPI